MTASVKAPENYTGYCPPITRVFTGTVTVSRIDPAGTTVQYRWAGPDFTGPTQTLAFAAGDPLSKEVTHTAQIADDGTVQRWIEILSPGTAASDTAEVQVDCEPLSIVASSIRVAYDRSACGTPGHGPAVIITTAVEVNGPVRVEYEWEINEGRQVTPGAFETDGPGTVTLSHRLESSPLTAEGLLRARLRFTSHTATGRVLDFSPPPCPSA